MLSALGIPFQVAADASLGDVPPADCSLPLLVGDEAATDFAALARSEEYSAEARDLHGRFLWAHTSSPSDATPRPVVSESALELLASVQEAARRRGLPLIRKEPWPHGKPMAACLTHDVDVVRRGKLPRGVAVRDVAGALADAGHGRFGRAGRRIAGIARTAGGDQDPYWTFDRIAALERDWDYRSTYFLMAGRHHPEDASYDLAEPRMAGLLRDLVDSGCEVALHGSYASFRDAVLLKEQKSLLEALLGRPVAGHRNHLLRFRAPDSWLAQEAAGLSYDSTLGFADREGFRGGHAFPFHPYDLSEDRALELLELPLAVMDVTFSKYRRLQGENAWDALRAVLDQTRAVNGLATLLWHNDSFYDPDHPGGARLYAAALAWLSAHGAHVATCEEVDRWWRARDSVRLTPLPASPDPGHGVRETRIGWRMETPREIDGLTLRVTLPDPRSPVRFRGKLAASLRRDGPDYLLEFARLPAGSSTDIEF